MIDKVETHLKAVEQFAETTPEAIEAFRIKNMLVKKVF